ncbi:MAG TPA: hypothetical protein VFX98_00630 [Longimicrobiaceae bacterium]|nr:hypothetical protein [Longimicrobiaceae bacterium]
MDRREEQRQKLERVAQEVGAVLRRQARRKWDGVRTAERNERGRHVWRFRSESDSRERFLHVTHEAMRQGNRTTAILLEQLAAGRWLDRLDAETTPSLVLSKGGQLEPWTGA